MTRLQKKMILLLWMMTSLHLFLIFWNFQVLLCTHAIYVLIRQVDPGFLDLPWFSSLAWSLEPRKLHSYFWVLDLGVGCFTQYLHFFFERTQPLTAEKATSCTKASAYITTRDQLRCLQFSSQFFGYVTLPRPNTKRWLSKKKLRFCGLFLNVLATKIFTIEVELRNVVA